MTYQLLKFQRSRLYFKIFIHIFQLYYTRYLYSYDCYQFYILTNVICKIRNGVLRLQSIYTINDLSIYLSCHYPDLGRAFNWSCHEVNMLQPIRSTSKNWVVTRHQYGILCSRFPDVNSRENQRCCRKHLYEIVFHSRG